MWLIFLLLLINGFERLSGAEHGTLCTSMACFTLNMERVSFEKAQQNCVHNGGDLMTLRDGREEEALLSLFSLIRSQRQDRGLKFWIGLKLHRQDCVISNKTLKGFKWVSGEEDSHYSNWKKQPIPTCTERCVQVDHTFSGPNQLKWTAESCKNKAFYACRFSFKGMCKPLALLGPGHKYIVPFSQKPQKSELKLFPIGTYVIIPCATQEPAYSVCMGSDRTYSWNNPGPFCKTGKPRCAINNGGCEHSCHQDTDDIRCSCNEGSDLEEDGLTCRMKDVCGPDTCEHECVMRESGYACKCPTGLELSENQRDCSDVDECQSEACEDHVCVNTHGSYTCACKDGYEMVDGKCSDVDECAQSKCQQNCLNSIGSFSCSCDEGFTLSGDELTCVDVDECVGNLCFAELVCVNTAGSFTCTDRRSVHLDGSTDAPHVTVTSDASSDDPIAGETQENLTESQTGTAVELQHQSPHTDAPPPDLVNGTHGDHHSNMSLNVAKTANSRVIICVLGSVVPLLVLVAVTLFIAIFRCSRSKKEAKKNTTTDGYCWVSSGLDPRLEKLYESILTDDL
ncbi:complement component C1q receptor [Embiotoca jacksoni]|uniref:complement component C1q receptor n=1 Tax=Embiotoca jacksoni TaxID=100190 RepID=UPI00370431DC